MFLGQWNLLNQDGREQELELQVVNKNVRFMNITRKTSRGPKVSSQSIFG